MKFYINDKEYNYDYLKMQKKFVGSGYEADTYKFDNMVFKFYKEICLKHRLNESSVKYLSKIPTQRILLPKDVIYDENMEFFGYTMPYIKNHDKDNIRNMKMSKLVNELKIIKEDLLLLKNKNVFVDDLYDSNFIFNNGFYLIDPGSYEINYDRSKEYIEIINREFIYDFITKCILFRDYKLNKNQKMKLLSIYPLNEYIMDIIEEDYNKNEKVYKYTDRIINNL